MQHIKYLFLTGTFSYFNLDRLTNLKMLSIVGTINKDFNIELFKNLCNQIMFIKIKLKNIDDKTLFKLFSGYSFPYLMSLTLRDSNLKRLEKGFINRFPFLSNLFIINCKLEVIEHDAFSNVNYLKCLDMSQNQIKFIERNTFTNLKNLEILDLSGNELTNLDVNFIGVKKSVDFLLDNKELATFNCYWYTF